MHIPEQFSINNTANSGKSVFHIIESVLRGIALFTLQHSSFNSCTYNQMHVSAHLHM